MRITVCEMKKLVRVGGGMGSVTSRISALPTGRRGFSGCYWLALSLVLDLPGISSSLLSFPWSLMDLEHNYDRNLLIDYD